MRNKVTTPGRWLLSGIISLACACSSGQGDKSEGDKNTADVTIGSDSFWSDWFPPKVNLSVESVPSVGPMDWSWQNCGRPLVGLHVDYVKPNGDRVELGVTDDDGFVEFRAEAGTYPIAINDTMQDLVFWNQLDGTNPASSITVGNEEANLSLFILSGEDHCPTCDALAAGTDPDCHDNVYRFCENGHLYQLDCALYGNTCVSKSEVDINALEFPGCRSDQ